MKNKKQFTLIELIIVIVIVGILAAMALPKFNGVVRNAKLSAMINDKEVLEKALIMYYQKSDELPLLNEDEELIIANEDIYLNKIVLAEEVKSSDMDTIYKSLKETLTYYNDSEETLYRIDLSKIKDNLSKDIKYGHKKQDKDFYVYSIKTGNVYYYDYLVNGNGTIQHSEYDTLLKDNELITKAISPSLSGEETIINNKPIIELTTNLEDITIDTIIKWEYVFTDEDPTPTKISFILNDVEYDSFDKIPSNLNSGDYTIRLKMQDSKGLWSDAIIKTFLVEKKIINENSIALGDLSTLRIGEDGNLYSWGNNDKGQLGIGNTITQKNPQKIILQNPNFVFAGVYRSMVINNQGDLYAWGWNNYGQLGIGNTITQTSPQRVYFPNGEKPISISLGYYHSMAITSEGNLYGWGENYWGQLGLGNTVNKLSPQKVTLPNGEKPISISAGGYHSMVITNKGNLYTWGYNGSGQLGIGSTVNKTTPQKVTLPNNEIPIYISSKYNHSMVITEQGSLYAWGENDKGQLGLGNTVNKPSPQKVTLPNAEKPISISLGQSHSIILTDKGNLYSCGYNGYGQLGIGDSTDKTTPQKVSIPNGEIPIYIIVGYKNSMAITNKGSVYGWGMNSYGEVTMGNNNQSLTLPTKITLP